jgi:hypothetical protein
MDQHVQIINQDTQRNEWVASWKRGRKKQRIQRNRICGSRASVVVGRARKGRTLVSASHLNVKKEHLFSLGALDSTRKPNTSTRKDQSSIFSSKFREKKQQHPTNSANPRKQEQSPGIEEQQENQNSE